jgi:FHA domain
MPDCKECGAKLEPAQSSCPECGAELEATASFKPVEGDQPIAEAGPLTGVKGPTLVLQKGHGAGEKFLIDQPTLCLGRDPSCDIFLNDVTVSRDHAVIEAVGDDIMIRDSGSLNGTYVNDQLVESAVLEDGDVVQIGTFCMAFVGKKGSAPQ